MSEFRDLVYHTADRVVQALDSASGNGSGRTAWDLKLELKTPAPLLYMALGVLVREGQIELEPHELTYRVRRAGPRLGGEPTNSALPNAPAAVSGDR